MGKHTLGDKTDTTSCCPQRAYSLAEGRKGIKYPFHYTVLQQMYAHVCLHTEIVPAFLLSPTQPPPHADSHTWFEKDVACSTYSETLSEREWPCDLTHGDESICTPCGNLSTSFNAYSDALWEWNLESKIGTHVQGAGTRAFCSAPPSHPLSPGESAF